MSTPQTAASRDVPGPVVPGERARLRPLGVTDVAIDGGVWGRWQRTNREISLPMAARRLEEAGNLHDLRLAAGQETGEFRGPLFMDSDLYKTAEAFAWENAREPDEKLREFIRTVASAAADAQEPDGYLNSYVQAVTGKRYDALDHSHEMYCAGHLIQAAVAAARGAGGQELLVVARRFADHLVAEFLDGGNDGIDGHPEIETALVELFRLTGHEPYLRLACKFLENRGRGTIGSRTPARYYQDHEPIRDMPTVAGHSVRALYLEAGIIDAYEETGDESLLTASVRRWEDMAATKTAITGGVGSRHAGEAFGDAFELPPDRAYNETCAAIASIQWSWRLLLATGEARYADLIERTLYNGFAASTSADGQRYFYVNPLQRRADHYEGDDPGRRKEWYSCACCPPNIMRLVASLGHYVATGDETGLQLHQYVPGTIRAAGRELHVETDYPWAETVRIEVRTAGEWELRLRVPSWSERTRVVVASSDDPSGDSAATAGEYVAVRRRWNAGDTVTLELDLRPRLVHPHPRVDALRGCVAIERGPLVHCVEQVDQDVDIETLSVRPDAVLRAGPVGKLPDVGRTVVLELQAVSTPWPAPAGMPYSDRPVQAAGTPVLARAIPYFQWDNRDGGPMRVWLPLTDT